MRNFFQALLALACLFFFNVNVKAQTTGYSGTGSNIDVIYQRCNWRINPDSVIGKKSVPVKAIGGSVLMRFITKGTVTNVTFDLSSAMTISKIVFRSANLPSANITRSGNVVTVALGVTLASNITEEIDIFYNGTPPVFDDYGEGYEQKPITGMGNVVYTLSESYGDDDWWPCKADMQDKIDAMDIIISMPSDFTAASNGILVKDEKVGDQRIMTYKTSYPIASYLVAVGVAKYTVFDRGTVNVSGTNVPIVYYVYAGRTPTAAQLNIMDYCKDQMVAFSAKYGDYPFKNEKYGMYEFGWGGGMEHQTFSAMGWNAMISWSVIAHELAHQWFGDKVTFATWNHLWLAEGFAKYSEVLAAELVTTMNKDAVAHRSGIKTTALARSTTPIYLSAASIQNSNTIWTAANDEAIYQRGAMVVSMLRKLAGDNKFFQACRNYLNDPALAYRSAVTDDLKNHFEAVLGYDLDPFFEDYIWGTGNPAYDINWGSATNSKSINIELTTQRRSVSSTVAYFRTPVVIYISNGLTGTAKKDTTVVIYDENGKLSYAGDGIRQSHAGRVLGYNLSFVPTSVTIDPNAETLVRGDDGTTARSTVTKAQRLNTAPMTVLPINIIEFKGNSSISGNDLSLLLSTTDENIKVSLERSEDAIRFAAIGEMLKSPLSSDNLSFYFLDKDISERKVYYYRVKTVDEKGVVKYSNVLRLVGEKSTDEVKLSPNPAISMVQIALPSAWQNKRVAYVVYNVQGREIKKEKFENAGSNIQVMVQQWAAGSYKIKLTGPGDSHVVRNFTVIH